eukprot:1160038-Pelagomonas_calceolata.AAC.7
MDPRFSTAAVRSPHPSSAPPSCSLPLLHGSKQREDKDYGLHNSSAGLDKSGLAFLKGPTNHGHHSKNYFLPAQILHLQSLSIIILGTSEGSVASDAEMWAKPVLPDTEAECAPCKLLQPCIAYLLPSDNQQQTIHQRLPHPQTRAGGAGPAPHCISKLRANFCALTSQLFVHITPSWIAKSPERAPPSRGLSKGINKSMLMEFVSTGAVPGA